VVVYRRIPVPLFPYAFDPQCLKEKLAAGELDISGTKKAIEELTTASHKLAEQVYKNTGQPQDPNASAQQPEEPNSQNEQQETSKQKPNDEGVVDAEYKDEGNSK